MSESNEQKALDQVEEVVEAKEEVKEVATEEVAVAEVTEVVAEEVVVEEAKEEAVEVVAEPTPSMDDFANEIDASMNKVEAGDIVECKVISVNEEEIIVNLGYVADGIIKKEELHVPAGEVINDHYSVDDVFKAEVLTTNDGEGNVAFQSKRQTK